MRVPWFLLSCGGVWTGVGVFVDRGSTLVVVTRGVSEGRSSDGVSKVNIVTPRKDCTQQNQGRDLKVARRNDGLEISQRLDSEWASPGTWLQGR